jgi:hypothetical protein
MNSKQLKDIALKSLIAILLIMLFVSFGAAAVPSAVTG